MVMVPLTRFRRAPRAALAGLAVVAAVLCLSRPGEGDRAGAVAPRPPGTEPAPLRYIQFPVLGPVVYSDNFGDCRDNCTRLHHGMDIIGVQMQPLVAATDGTVSRIVHGGSKSGNGVVITDDDGWSYVYYHVNNDPPGGVPEATTEATGDVIDRWMVPPGIEVGARVTAGQVIGWMGNSGNAERSVVHLHFELRDPSRRPVNPFTSLRIAEFYGRCLPSIQRPLPITSPPSVVDGTVYRFPTAYLEGTFTVSLTGGVLAEAGATFVGNPNYEVPACDQPMELPVARSLGDQSVPADQPDLVDPAEPVDDRPEEVGAEPAVPITTTTPTTSTSTTTTPTTSTTPTSTTAAPDTTTTSQAPGGGTETTTTTTTTAPPVVTTTTSAAIPADPPPSTTAPAPTTTTVVGAPADA